MKRHLGTVTIVAVMLGQTSGLFAEMAPRKAWPDSVPARPKAAVAVSMPRPAAAPVKATTGAGPVVAPVAAVAAVAALAQPAAPIKPVDRAPAAVTSVSTTALSTAPSKLPAVAAVSGPVAPTAPVVPAAPAGPAAPVALAAPAAPVAPTAGKTVAAGGGPVSAPATCKTGTAGATVGCIAAPPASKPEQKVAPVVVANTDEWTSVTVPRGGGAWLPIPTGKPLTIEVKADETFQVLITREGGPEAYDRWFGGDRATVPVVKTSPESSRHLIRVKKGLAASYYLVLDNANYPDGTLTPFANIQAQVRFVEH
ncbi:MAG: hypothetical protein HY815_16115 [Candidatus Riflebacteria bacterium]|nr:hypothetical protein [Candidatus Riflebacteria bacterium]